MTAMYCNEISDFKSVTPVVLISNRAQSEPRTVLKCMSC